MVMPTLSYMLLMAAMPGGILKRNNFWVRAFRLPAPLVLLTALPDELLAEPELRGIPLLIVINKEVREPPCIRLCDSSLKASRAGQGSIGAGPRLGQPAGHRRHPAVAPLSPPACLGPDGVRGCRSCERLTLIAAEPGLACVRRSSTSCTRSGRMSCRRRLPRRWTTNVWPLLCLPLLHCPF